VLPCGIACIEGTLECFRRSSIHLGLHVAAPVAAIIGGALGTTIMHHHLNKRHMKKLIDVRLLALAAKMIWIFIN
jgi:uncharacterized membrane protein YfcA